MKIGIMQPYFFPYIGYWQLMNAVDKYVVYDDVNFIKGGWINRNRILVNGQPVFINLPMLGASPNKKINEVEVNNVPQIIDKNLRKIENSYKKAPYFDEVFPIIERIMKCGREDIGSYIFFSFEELSQYFNINTDFVLSSSLKKDDSLRGQDKVINICELLGGTEYYNAIGGKELYSYDAFLQHDINLSFLETKHMEYKQFGNEFQANLSIIDVMMFNSRDEIQDMLKNYELISR